MPARRLSRRAGFFVSSLVVALSACEPQAPARGPELELNDGAIRLEPGAQVHDIRVAITDQAEFDPAGISARRGDAVRFVAGDARTHAIVFEAARLPVAGRDFLDATDQLRGPPLITPGAVWIVSLDEAPPGRYPFTCLTHGGNGVLEIAGEH